MNVLLITTLKNPAVGGIAVWTKHYLSRCIHHKLFCTVINTEKNTKKPFDGFANELLRTKRIITDLRHTLKMHRYDIAHLNTSCGPLGLFRDYLIATILYKEGIPVVTHYHCDIPHWITTSLKRYILKKLSKTSCLNLVLCESSRIYLQNLNIDSIKVPNFIEESVIANHPKEIRDICSRIFFVGRVSESKGAREIYELARRFPDKLFALAGGLVSPVDTWKKPANVQLMGRLTSDNIIRLLDQSDLFLFPSHSEGFSLALMEAMARGVPCVAFDSVGANEDMLSDDCGVTVPYKDVDAMEQAIRDLEDPTKRKIISKNAIAKVRNQYTTDTVLSSLNELYDDQL